ncbi:MAG: hypothetical protein HRU19_18030 [Pseudobacteriovorax sp.]|nr:hypothetical protein [Pseudobacteriovorax sp.]
MFQIAKRFLGQTSLPIWQVFLMEFCLIVVSILIAFSLQNWNQDLQKKQELKNLLVVLQNELETNLAQLKSDEVIRRRVYTNIESLISQPEEIEGLRGREILLKMTSPTLGLTTVETTAWEIAKDRQILTNLSFENLRPIKRAYKVQNFIDHDSNQEILEHISKSFYNSERFDIELLQLKDFYDEYFTRVEYVQKMIEFAIEEIETLNP